MVMFADGEAGQKMQFELLSWSDSSPLPKGFKRLSGVWVSGEHEKKWDRRCGNRRVELRAARSLSPTAFEMLAWLSVSWGFCSSLPLGEADLPCSWPLASWVLAANWPPRARSAPKTSGKWTIYTNVRSPTVSAGQLSPGACCRGQQGVSAGSMPQTDRCPVKQQPVPAPSPGRRFCTWPVRAFRLPLNQKKKKRIHWFSYT